MRLYCSDGKYLPYAICDKTCRYPNEAYSFRDFDREPFIQNTEQKATYFVLASMVFAILNYLRFAKSVIWQMYVHFLLVFAWPLVYLYMILLALYSTDFTGLACFTVRHKDEQGGWVDNQQAVDDRKKQ
jgi:ethanolaminephosphotransferase